MLTTKKAKSNLTPMTIDHFNYEGNAISIIINGDVKFNATQMAKKFGKRPSDWLRTEESKSYIDALSKSQKCDLADLVKVKYGGSNDEKGTWFESKLAIRFAQWLNPYFAVAVDAHLESLLFKPTKLKPELAVPDDIPNVSRNYIFKPTIIIISNNSIRRVNINDKFYYCLVDIQKSAGMGKYRSRLQREVEKCYSFKIRTASNGKLANYINKDGIIIMLKRTSLKQAESFLIEFLSYISPFITEIDYKKFDYAKFLDIIVKTKDDKDREFLYNIYKNIGGI